jgi:hypothetical protein
MLGGPVVRQHYVEFIRGTGVKLDGVVDGTSTNGPWTWVVPKDVATIFVTGVGAGGGGGSSGSPSTPSARGNGGGGSGVGAIFLECAVSPGANLTVTVGAKGAATVSGGASTITNLVLSPFDNTTTLDLKGGGSNAVLSATTGGTGANSGYALGVGGTPPSNAATPAVGNPNGLGYFAPILGGYVLAAGGSSCGGASTNGATAGESGGLNPATSWLHSMFLQTPTAGTGDQTGTLSRSGGGLGGSSIIGYGGNGGNAATNGNDATGYGAGGGGAGGYNATGGSGSDGYIGIFYWSAD